MDQPEQTPSDLVALPLTENDFLGIELVSDAEGRERFLLRARSLTTNPNEKAAGSGRYFVNGVVHYDHWNHPSEAATSFFQNPLLAECTWDKKNERWKSPTTDTLVIAIERCWTMARVLFSTDETKARFDAIRNEFYFGEAVAAQAARFKQDGLVPTLPDIWQELKERPLSPYQRAAVKLSLDVPAFALFMDRGTGKTACAVQRVCILAKMLASGEIHGGVEAKDGSRMLRVLIVVPKNVRLNWQREFNRFAHVQGKVTVLRGGLRSRIAKLAEAARPTLGMKFSVLICSYDGLRTSQDYISMIPWDDVITDESHYYKDPSTDRFQSLVKIREVSRRRMSLTGTPIGNSPMDLWSQLEFLRQGSSGFTSRKAFKAFHGVWEKTSVQGVEKLIGIKNIPLLQERLARISFSISKEDAGLNLPDKVYTVREVEMTPHQAEIYNTLQAELALEIEDKLSGDVVDEVTVSNVLTMLLRLAQVTSGFITYDARYDPHSGECVTPARKVDLDGGNPKIEELLELLQDESRDPKAKTIVWCQFIHNIHQISAALTKAGIKHGCYYGGVSTEDRDTLVDSFNKDPEFKVLICNPQTAGEGLNLLGYDVENPETSLTYCDMEVFFSIGWSSILRLQAEDRAHRRGTRMPVQIIDLVVPGSIDEEILDRLMQKQEIAKTVTDLKDTLSRILSRKVA